MKERVFGSRINGKQRYTVLIVCDGVPIVVDFVRLSSGKWMTKSSLRGTPRIRNVARAVHRDGL